MLYQLLRTIARLALRWFYRDIEVVGGETIPHFGPVLLAGNHPNALIDPLVIGAVVPRRITLTAKATLLANPITRLLVRAVGIVPLRRASDEARQGSARLPDPSRNEDAFAAILDALERGAAVLIFPEGKSHNDPELAPLKTGLARIALQARGTRGLHGLSVVPVGLTFEQKDLPRSRVVVHVGCPIQVDTVSEGTAEGTVKALTTKLDAGLRTVTLNFRSRDDAERVLEISGLLAGVLDTIRPLHAPDTPLAETFRVARRIEEVQRALPSFGPALLTRVEHFLIRLDAFRDSMYAHGIEANELGMSMSAGAGARFLLREGTITAIAGPLAIWGYLNHWLPLRLARVYARKVSRYADEPAMRTIVAGLVLILLFYTLQTAAVASLAGWVWAMLYAVSLPLSASWDFQFRDRMRHALGRVRSYFALRRNPEVRESLRREAAWLREEAIALDRDFSIATEAAEAPAVLAIAGNRGE